MDSFKNIMESFECTIYNHYKWGNHQRLSISKNWLKIKWKIVSKLIIIWLDHEFVHHYFIPKMESTSSIKHALENSINLAKDRGTIIHTN